MVHRIFRNAEGMTESLRGYGTRIRRIIPDTDFHGSGMFPTDAHETGKLNHLQPHPSKFPNFALFLASMGHFGYF